VRGGGNCELQGGRLVKEGGGGYESNPVSGETLVSVSGAAGGCHEKGEEGEGGGGRRAKAVIGSGQERQRGVMNWRRKATARKHKHVTFAANRVKGGKVQAFTGRNHAGKEKRFMDSTFQLANRGSTQPGDGTEEAEKHCSQKA